MAICSSSEFTLLPTTREAREALEVNHITGLFTTKHLYPLTFHCMKKEGHRLARMWVLGRVYLRMILRHGEEQTMAGVNLQLDRHTIQSPRGGMACCFIVKGGSASVWW